MNHDYQENYDSAEDIPAPPDTEVDKRHPTPEQMMIRQAIKYLTPKQKEIWELYNYDRLTHDEIAKKLGVSQPNITQQIRKCEARIDKWINSNMAAYRLLKEQCANDD